MLNIKLFFFEEGVYSKCKTVEPATIHAKTCRLKKRFDRMDCQPQSKDEIENKPGWTICFQLSWKFL